MDKLKNFKIEEQLNNCVFAGKTKDSGERVFIFTIGPNVVSYPIEKITLLADDIAKIVKDLNIEYTKILNEIGNKVNNTIALFFLLFKTQSHITNRTEEDGDMFFFNVLKDLKNFIINDNGDKNNIDKLNELLTLTNIFKHIERLEKTENETNEFKETLNNFIQNIKGQLDMTTQQMELL